VTVTERLLRWGLGLAWAAVPFTVWPAIGDALHGESDPLRITAAAGAWAVWAVVLIAPLVPHPLGLTALRCVTPASLVAVVLAVGLGRGHVPVLTLALALGWAAIVVTAAFLPLTGVIFVNGPAYPNERRYLLGVPGALLLGPVELAWCGVAGLPTAAALLLAARQWVLGGVCSVLAVAAVWVLGRALYRLTRRWVVFVPAGLVLHDAASLAEPVLFRRQVIDSLGPAAADSDSLDLTQRALGLALELQLTEKVEMSRITPQHRGGEAGASARLLFTPTRPGMVLAEAATRRIRVGLPQSSS